MIVMALYALGVVLADEGWRATGDLFAESMLVGAMYMFVFESEWLWVGGTVGAATGLMHAFWSSIVRRVSLTTTRRLVAVGSLVAAGLIFAWVLSRAEDRSTIEARYLEFCTATHDKEYKVAYEYLSPAYRKFYDVDWFAEDYTSKGWCVPECTLDPRHHVSIRGRKATLLADEVSFGYLYSGCVLEMEKVDGVWYFNGESYWSYD